MSWPHRTGAGGATTTTAAALAAGALAGTLSPGLAIDENGVSYVITSATTYYPLAASPHLGTMTFATALAYPSWVTGMTFNASDVGNQSPLYRYDGSNLKPAGGRQLAFRLSADAGQTTFVGAGTGLTEVSLAGCSCALPIRSLDFTGAELEWTISMEKLGGIAESPTATLRLGSTGGIADTLLAGAYTFATTNKQSGSERSAMRQSATTFRLQGPGNAASTAGKSGTSTNARVAASACANTNTTINYLGLTTVASVASPAEYVAVNRFDVYVIG